MDFLKPGGNVSSKCQGEGPTMSSVVVRTSFMAGIFCALLDAHSRSLSYVLQIECKHASRNDISKNFLSETDVNKVTH